jgi:hypothetical protein
MFENRQGGNAEKPHCCFCESENVTLISPFGTAQLVRQYYCRSCKSVFEFIRWQQKIPTDEKV